MIHMHIYAHLGVHTRVHMHVCTRVWALPVSGSDSCPEPPHRAARPVGRPPASAASSRISRGCVSPRRLDEFCCGSGPRPLFQFIHLTNQCARGWWVEAGSVFKIRKTDVLHKQIGASGRCGGKMLARGTHVWPPTRRVPVLLCLSLFPHRREVPALGLLSPGASGAEGVRPRPARCSGQGWVMIWSDVSSRAGTRLSSFLAGGAAGKWDTRGLAFRFHAGAGGFRGGPPGGAG